MDIVIATRFYPPETGGGGIAAYARYLANGLARRGHRVRVISERTLESPKYKTADGIEVHRISPFRLPYRLHRLPVAGRHTRFINDLSYACGVRRQLLRLAREGKPDVVEYADIHAEGLFHPFGLCPAVVKLHTPHFVLDRFYSDRERPYDTRLIRWAERRAILRATALSSPSRDLAEQVAGECGLCAAVIADLPNGIDTTLFAPPEKEDEVPPIVLFVGRLEPRKGALVFADAIPRIARACSSARFLFLGADRSSKSGASQRQELLVRFDKEILSRIDFEGHAGPEVFRDHYRRAAVFVMPSLFENCPYTLLEALACGRAVVASRAYGMQEMIIDGKSGLFFHPGDSDDLAQKVISLLRDCELRRRLRQGARTAVLERYSLEGAAEAAEQFYRRTIAQ